MATLFTYSARNIWVRRNTTLATVVGISLVVFVLASSLMLVRGVRVALSGSGSADNAVVMRQAAAAEISSNLRQAVFGLVAAAPGVQKTSTGAVLASGELVQSLSVPAADASRIASLQVRGVGDDVYELRPQVRIVAGRRLSPGTDEAMIGSAAVGRYAGIALGSDYELDQGRTVKIVGVFSAAGAAFESELWQDLRSLQSATRNEGFISSVTVRLTSPEAFDSFAQALELGNREEGLAVEREATYYERLARGLSRMILALSGLVTLIFALAASLGAAIAMYAAVEQRTRELGVLCALGFSRSQVLLTVLTEAAGLSLVGTCVGLLLASLTTLAQFTIANTAAGSAEMSFRFVPSAAILATAGVAGILVGVLGGAFPALRAARIDPVVAMRV
jgi:putative ABC transport system permease protein